MSESFVKILQLAQELKLAKFGQVTVSIDGTKIAANASKHAAVSDARAGEQLAQLDLEVQQLLAKAEQADATPLQDGLTIPEEIARRQERQAALAKARAEIEARAHARYAAALVEHEKKMAARLAQEAAGKKPRGRPPSPPSAGPTPKDQYNFTDPESRIMKDGTGFGQSYNAQAAVEVDSRLIVGARVSQAPNDKQELAPTLAAIPPAVSSVRAVLADNGFYSEAAVRKIEQTVAGEVSGTTVYAALDKTSHHRSVADLEQKPEPPVPPAGASVAEAMRQRLQSTAGKRLYSAGQQNANRRSNRCSGSSRRCSASGSSFCAAPPKCPPNGPWCASPTTSSGCMASGPVENWPSRGESVDPSRILTKPTRLSGSAGRAPHGH